MNDSNTPLPSAVAPATLLAPRADLFAVRAARLRRLAPGHALGDWLAWLADLCAAQQAAFDAVPDLGLRRPEPFDPARPPLAGEQPALDRAWRAAYASLRAAAPGFGRPGLPGAGDCDESELERRAAACRHHAAGELPAAPGDATDLLLAAALQVAWSAAARQLAPPAVVALHDSERCPCCASHPVGSIVLAGDGKAGLRYLECSLCATRWNAVRARCTLCADGGVVGYLGLEGSHPAVQAESCDHCHGYIKTFFQDKAQDVDPVADDLASLALDVLVGEQGYGRGTPNLFLGEGIAA